MKTTFRPRLLNGRTGDPALLLTLRWQGRALLVDCGRIGPTPASVLLPIEAVFVSHTHMDHFMGFDQLLRIFLARDTSLRFFGPEGLADGEPALPAGKERIGRLAAAWQVSRRFERDDRRAAVAAPPVPAGIRRDREEPRRDRGAAVVLMRPGNHLDEHLLRHFLGGLVVGKHPAREPQQSRGVALEELFRAAGVAPADPLEETPVVA